METNKEALMQAHGCFAAMDAFRRQRERCKRFNYGDQWSDPIEVNGLRGSEGEYLRKAGALPLKNNLIRRLVRNVIGVYSSQSNEPRCVARDPEENALANTMTTLLRYNGDLNRMSAVLTRTLEEFMISGVAVHRKWYGKRNGRFDCWTDYVSPATFFVDGGMRDFRSWDCSCIGQVHELSLGDVCARFANEPQQALDIRKAYAELSDPDFQFEPLCGEQAQPSLFQGARHGRCLVVEMWRREHRQFYVCHDPIEGVCFKTSPSAFHARVAAENARREAQGLPLIAHKWLTKEVWRYYYLTPQGYVLASGDSPYGHRSHPFVVKAYPLIDGEVHSFVADVIDQQKYTNRLISTYDWIIRSSAKGVLLIPEGSIPYGEDANTMANAWSKTNGVLIYKSTMTGEKPEQVVTPTAQAGISELLNLQMKLFEDISGVHGALEGKLSSGSTSAALYGQQTEAATTALLDLLGAFDEFVRDGAFKDVANIQQFYDEPRIRMIAGEAAAKAMASLEQFRAAEFDLSIAPNTDTPATRQANNQVLMEIWKNGQISLEQMLRASSFSFAPELLSQIAQKEQTNQS